MKSCCFIQDSDDAVKYRSVGEFFFRKPNIGLKLRTFHMFELSLVVWTKKKKFHSISICPY